jgi:hypothetical protein
VLEKSIEEATEANPEKEAQEGAEGAAGVGEVKVGPSVAG